jgi:transcriptional regulator with XRE-family HTH domain
MFNKNLDNLIHARRVNKTDLSRYLMVARSTLDAWLKGNTQMPADKIQEVAAFFGVTVGSLFGEAEENDKSLRKTVEDQQREIEKLNKKIETIAKTLQMKSQ